MTTIMCFRNEDEAGVHYYHRNASVIRAEVEGDKMIGVLEDKGSSFNIIFRSTFT